MRSPYVPDLVDEDDCTMVLTITARDTTEQLALAVAAIMEENPGREVPYVRVHGRRPDGRTGWRLMRLTATVSHEAAVPLRELGFIVTFQ